MRDDSNIQINHWIEIPGGKLDHEDALIDWLESESRIENLSGIYNLVFVDKAAIRQIHKEFLGKDSATDVIAFDLTEEEDDFKFIENPEDDELIKGEVYVCLEQAQEQSVEYKVGFSEEAGRLALHGLLHLAGWEDSNEVARDEMKTREDEGLERGRLDSGEYPWNFILHAQS